MTLCADQSGSSNVMLLRHADTWQASAFAGFGAYGAVGFSYGGETTPMLPPPPRPGAADDSDEYTDSESDSEDDTPKTLNEQEREAFAAGFGIMSFDSTLRRAERNEKAEAEGRVPKPK